MSHPVAVIFALSMAVWVADVGFAPHAAATVTPEPSCQPQSDSAPSDADAEITVCASRTPQR